MYDRPIRLSKARDLALVSLAEGQRSVGFILTDSDASLLTLWPDEAAADQYIQAANAFRMQKQGKCDRRIRLIHRILANEKQMRTTC
jgi:hypothetical protein